MPLQDQDLLVSDLLSRETKEWNQALIEKLLPELKEHILSIRPSITGTSDSYIWTQQKSGIYSAKSGYYAAQREKIQSTSTLLDHPNWNWQKYIRNPKLLPKVKFFIWRCAINNLPTGENLQKRGLLTHTLCTKCGEVETLEHILFQCETAKKVWELFPWTVTPDPQDVSPFRSMLQSSFTKVNLPPLGTSANLFAWICWSLWLNRNQLTFENKQVAPIEILSKSIRLLKDWEHAQIKPPQAPNIPPPLFPNQIAASSTTVCFTDAAWNKATNEAGLAWIFTTRSGQEISRGCLYQEHVSSALMADSLAIRAALGHAASLDITIIWLRSDCKGLIQAITTNHRSVELFGVLADIESIISTAFLSFHASFLPRSQNGPADSLAKASLCNKTSPH